MRIHFASRCQMDRQSIDEQLEKHCELLDVSNQTFERIVSYYEVILDSFFSDGVYHLGRFFLANYFAQFIVNRAPHLDSRHLLRTLSEKFDERWKSSLNSSDISLKCRENI